MASESRTVRPNANTLHRELGGEGVLLQLDTGEYFGLDEIGERIWALLMEDGDLTRVQSRLIEEFDAEPTRVASDLQVFVDELARRRLIDLAAQEG
jgi:hypothetical protein